LDEGVRLVDCRATVVPYTLTQLRLGSKLPSLHNPLPHGKEAGSGLSGLKPSDYCSDERNHPNPSFEKEGLKIAFALK